MCHVYVPAATCPPLLTSAEPSSPRHPEVPGKSLSYLAFTTGLKFPVISQSVKAKKMCRSVGSHVQSWNLCGFRLYRRKYQSTARFILKNYYVRRPVSPQSWAGCPGEYLCLTSLPCIALLICWARAARALGKSQHSCSGCWKFPRSHEWIRQREVEPLTCFSKSKQSWQV